MATAIRSESGQTTGHCTAPFTKIIVDLTLQLPEARFPVLVRTPAIARVSNGAGFG